MKHFIHDNKEYLSDMIKEFIKTFLTTWMPILIVLMIYNLLR